MFNDKSNISHTNFEDAERRVLFCFINTHHAATFLAYDMNSQHEYVVHIIDNKTDEPICGPSSITKDGEWIDDMVEARRLGIKLNTITCKRCLKSIPRAMGWNKDGG